MAKINPGPALHRSFIKPDALPTASKIATGQAPNRHLFTFSLQYWQQQEHFGLNQVDVPWFVSVLERLRDMSKYLVDEFLVDGPTRKNWRYHEVDWGARAIPINREDLTSLPRNILENEAEFPLFQFQISRALGRVAGIWIDQVFHIVLLDPGHNLQPSGGKFAYRIDDAEPQDSAYSILDLAIQQALAAHCSDGRCGVRHALEYRETDRSRLEGKGVLLLHLTAEQFVEAKTAIEPVIELGLFDGWPAILVEGARTVGKLVEEI